jgi:hypothetical protein
MERPVGLDFRLPTPFATNHGDIHGRGFKAKLQATDRAKGPLGKPSGDVLPRSLHRFSRLLPFAGDLFSLRFM